MDGAEGQVMHCRDLSTDVELCEFDLRAAKRKHDAGVAGRVAYMRAVHEYQERAKRCAEQALLVTRADDRARWLQLADEWIAVSRIEFCRLRPMQQREIFGLWREESLQPTKKKAVR